MSTRENTIKSALDAVRNLCDSSILTDELDFFNNLYSWNLTTPKTFLRGFSGQAAITATPYILLKSSADAAMMTTSSYRGYHSFLVHLTLGITKRDVSADADQETLTDAGTIYAECIRRAFMTDLTTTDPSSILRQAGLVDLDGVSTSYDVVQYSAKTSANYIKVNMDISLVQVRPQRAGV